MNIFDRIFKDKHGKLAIIYLPNVPLWGFIVCRVLARVIRHGSWHTGFDTLGTAFIFLWAYLEITAGTSVFRRVLGSVVMALTVTSFFHS
jgi:hypothetical protein